jgi:phosphate transport system permease protein
MNNAGSSLAPRAAQAPLVPRNRIWRRTVNTVARGLSFCAAVLGICFLAWILITVVVRGVGALQPSFFLELPPPPGVAEGGLGNAMLGTLYVTALGMLFGVPTGMMAGVFLNEFGRHSRFGGMVRFTVNLMMGIPSIIMGLFVFTIIVVPAGHFSGLAGGVALALLIVPIVARTTEDMLNLVPPTLRESALALGAPRWRVTFGVLFPVARAGIVTGVLLALARVSGETAPLLFTALNSPYWPESIFKPMANLTVTIFAFAMSPYKDWQQLAWGASLFITAVVLAVTIAARVILHRRSP